MAACGDLADMTFLDQAYWLHKTTRPVRHAIRGSELEAHFAQEQLGGWDPPAGFQAEQEITLSSAGDLIGHEYLRASAGVLYEDVADLLFDADLCMANLECPVVPGADVALTFDMTKGPRLFYDEEQLDIVCGHRDRRFSFLATACNHSLDFGAEGLDTTLDALSRLGIQTHGSTRAGSDSLIPCLLDVKGIRIGVFAATFGLNAKRPPPDRPRIVNHLPLNGRPDEVDLGPVERSLEAGRERDVDLMVAHLHWGFEHEFFPRPEQVQMAHRLAEMGIDVIIGHHPHVVQPAELYRPRRDPDRVVPIFYSLGNLVNAFSAPYLRRSDIARVSIVKGRREDGREATYVCGARRTGVMQVVAEGEARIRICREARSHHDS